MKRILVVLALSLSLGSASAQAAVLYLKDGGTLSGTVVGATSQDVELQTPDGATVRVGTDRISRIDYQDSAAAPGAPPVAAPVESREPARRSIRFRQTPAFDRGQEFTFNLGIGMPLGRVSLKDAGGGSGSNGRAGFHGGLQYLTYGSPRLGLGMAFDFLARSSYGTGGMLPSADTVVYGRSILLMGVARYALTNHGASRPYLLLGLGAHNTTMTIDAAPQVGFTWSDTSTAETRTLIDDQRWGLAGTVRFGIDIDYYAPYLFCFELGWTGMSTEKYDATTQGRDLGLEKVSGPLSAFTIAGRWGWRF